MGVKAYVLQQNALSQVFSLSLATDQGLYLEKVMGVLADVAS